MTHRSRRYLHFAVLVLISSDSTSTACHFSLQIAAAVDDPLRSLPGRRAPFQSNHGEHLYLLDPFMSRLER